MDANVAVIILAAGGSKRLGRPKQLLPVGGRPMLQVAIEAALALGNDVPILVVLGANHDEIQAKVDFDRCRVLINEDWQSGMASSIRLAVDCTLNDLLDIKGVILMVGDQPHVSTQVLRDLLDGAVREGTALAVSSFCAPESDKKVCGPPAYFGGEYFRQLLQLEGDVGARPIVQANLERAAIVDFAAGAVDIDSEADYRGFMAESGSQAG